jgi:hypothetical protein
LEALLRAQIISPAPKSGPFLITEPKERFIVDFSELTPHFPKLSMYFPTFLKRWNATGLHPDAYLKTRLDLRHAFYQIAIHPAARPVTRFSASGRTFIFNRLLMGTPQSPAVLQAVLSSILNQFPHIPVFKHLHVDNMLVVATPYWFRVHWGRFLLLLRKSAVTINERKFILVHTTGLSYCGVVLDLPSGCVILKKRCTNSSRR